MSPLLTLRLFLLEPNADSIIWKCSIIITFPFLLKFFPLVPNNELRSNQRLPQQSRIALTLL